MNIIPQERPLSFSARESYLSCNAKYRNSYISGLKSSISKSSMLAGKIFDELFNTAMISYHDGIDFDLSKVLDKQWALYFEKSKVTYGVHETPESIRENLEYVYPLILPHFINSGLAIMLRNDGSPCIQHENIFDIGRGVKVRTFIDLVVYDPNINQVYPLDVKFTSPTVISNTSTSWISMSEQILLYAKSIEMDRNLSVDEVSYGGFWMTERKKVPELDSNGHPKRKNSFCPRILDPIVQPLSLLHKNLIPQKYMQTQIDINHKKFLPSTASAYNTPCNLCDFTNLCAYGDSSDLQKKYK